MAVSISDSRLTLVDSDSVHAPTGVRFRRTRPGPELDLVDAFLAAMPLQIQRGCRATLFREPHLESGFPDIVIVTWREQVTQAWRSERRCLEKLDLRIIHFLHHARRAKLSDLVEFFGRGALSSVERLSEARMVRSVGSSWIPHPLRDSFAATKIIAVEAKVGRWNGVLNQALLNTWFASKSYVLVPNRPSDSQLGEARSHGIGVCSFDDGRVREVEAEPMRLPRSYASWVLNDWAWQSSSAS